MLRLEYFNGRNLFKISRSIFTRLSAARCCLMPSRSALSGCGCFQCLALPECPSSADEMPWAQATSLCQAPAATWRTRSDLKSSGYSLRVAGKPPGFSFPVMDSES